MLFSGIASTFFLFVSIILPFVKIELKKKLEKKKYDNKRKKKYLSLL